MKINTGITAAALKSKVDQLWTVSGDKIKAIASSYPKDQGAPVFTVVYRFDQMCGRQLHRMQRQTFGHRRGMNGKVRFDRLHQSVKA